MRKGNKQGREWAEFPQNDGGGMRMKIRDCMTAHVVCVGAEEPAETAARLMARYNLGLLPVRGADGRMCGVVTDRDLVLRCMAAGQEAGKLPVARAMSNRVVSVSPDDPAERAARTMARERVRRLPVVEDGKLVGMVSLGDLARQRAYAMEAGECLGAVCTSVRRMDG